MKKTLIVAFLTLLTIGAFAQQKNKIYSFTTPDSVKVTIDEPKANSKAISLIFYALPNGNTTAQTMGKKMKEGDDWHYNIQHIRAQTTFLRNQIKDTSIVVVYLENNLKSWPAWKKKFPDHSKRIQHLVDSIYLTFAKKHKTSVCLNGHSGGGSLIFGYLAAVDQVPSFIKRITFIDSNYGYDSVYYPKLQNWLVKNKSASMNVFAYDDSTALYKGKPFVSATGGTWYRSHLMLKHFSKDFEFSRNETDSLIIYKSNDQRLQFFFKKNFNRGIYHTEQVAKNGFIHSILCGTQRDSKSYSYYSEPAYTELISD